ncbi:MAG: aminotransferase class I/II-fold pyridoxal phosphate-dependent enzyme [Acetobacterium sp.]
MKKSILKKQLEHLNENNQFRFHMPGHKSRGEHFEFYTYDITEIPGADNLHDPQGVIAEVQDKCAKIYGSEAANILVNGTTTGIHSAILGACSPGEKLLVPRNCHRSVFGALALGRIEGVFITPEFNKEIGFAKEVSLDSVKEAIIKYPESQGMVLTNPTYYGTTSDVKAIANYLHSQGKFLIVDEAHGAHLCFNKKLPLDAIAAGADVTIQSTHKILGSLTQSSLIHFQGNRINRDRVKHFLALLQSSSPSYPLMMSVEEAVDTAFEKGEEVFQKIIEAHDAFFKNQSVTAPITLYKEDSSGNGYDQSKWLFHTRGITGNRAEQMLSKNYGIQCELSGYNHVLAMTGMGTTQSDLDALSSAIEDLNKKIMAAKLADHLITPGPDLGPENYDLGTLKTEIPLWEGLYSHKERQALADANGRLAGDFIIPYPPGIPVLLPGSRINKEIIAALNQLMDQGISIVGINKNRELLLLEEKGVLNEA